MVGKRTSQANSANLETHRASTDDKEATRGAHLGGEVGVETSWCGGAGSWCGGGGGERGGGRGAVWCGGFPMVPLAGLKVVITIDSVASINGLISRDLMLYRSGQCQRQCQCMALGMVPCCPPKVYLVFLAA